MSEIIFEVSVIFVLYVLIIIGTWNMYEKAGKPGWASLVPLYDVIVLFKIADIPSWTIILLFIPYLNFFAGFILYIMITVNLCHNFGKSSIFCLGMFFLPFIFYPILGFDSSSYKYANSNEVDVSIEKTTDKIIQERLKSEVNGLGNLNSNYIPSATPVINNNVEKSKIEDKVVAPSIDKEAPAGLKKCKKCGTVSIIFNQKLCSNCGEEL